MTDIMDHMARDSSYGRACVNCARNKSKCMIQGGDGATCERCHRLGKECRPSPSIRRRNHKKPIASKTAQLEEKIDGLMSIFNAQPVVSNTGHGQASIIVPDHEFRGDLQSYGTYPTPSARSSSATYAQLPAQVILTPGTSTFSSHPASPANTFAYMHEPTSTDADYYLKLFRTQHLKYFPFVHIPPETTAEQLQQQSPFLWLCIMSIFTQGIVQQQALNKQIKSVVAQRLLHDSESSMDLLLGLLAFIGWSNLQAHTKLNLSLYAQLAETMVFDLSLNKPKPKSDQLVLCTSSQTYYKPPSRSMEERRAVLGCFLITSIIASFVQKIDALRWTPHMDECLRTLSVQPDCANDETLVQLVRLQLVVEKVGHWQEEYTEDTEHSKMPPAFFVASLQSQLEEIGAPSSFPPHSSEVLAAHFHSTSLTVNETALFAPPVNSSKFNSCHVESLYACLHAVKSWFDVFFTIPPSDYIGFPYSIFSQLSHCLITLYRLSSCEDSSWPKPEVQKTADVLSILDKVIENLTQVSPPPGLDSTDTGDDVFATTARRFRSVRAGWEAKLDGDLMMPTGAVASNIEGITPYDMSMLFSESEWPADDWLTDILTSMRT